MKIIKSFFIKHFAITKITRIFAHNKRTTIETLSTTNYKSTLYKSTAPLQHTLLALKICNNVAYVKQVT